MICPRCVCVCVCVCFFLSPVPFGRFKRDNSVWLCSRSLVSNVDFFRASTSPGGSWRCSAAFGQGCLPTPRPLERVPRSFWGRVFLPTPASNIPRDAGDCVLLRFQLRQQELGPGRSDYRMTPSVEFRGCFSRQWGKVQTPSDASTNGNA